MNKIIAVLIGLIGLVVSAYVGIVVMLVGGITQALDGLQADPKNNGDIAWGIAKVILGDTAAAIVFYLFIIAAIAVWYFGEEHKSKRTRPVKLGRPLR